ncbi:MAG: hypothetical protein FJ271_27415 [Planctomycetes bacterium]|nr:hypothetical protein [Planctomycetota bacterium]
MAQVGMAHTREIDGDTLITWQWFASDGFRRSKSYWVIGTDAARVAAVERKQRPKLHIANRREVVNGGDRLAKWATENWEIVAT